MTDQHDEDLSTLLTQFNEAANILELNENQKRRVLGFITGKTDTSIEWLLKASVDTQARAKSIIKIANGLKVLSENGQDRTITDLITEYFDSHDEMVDYLAENFNHDERRSQITSALRL